MTHRTVLAAVLGMGLVLASAPVEAKVIGPCRFDDAKLRFEGTVEETAACLLRKVRPRGSGADPQPVPAWLLQRVGRPTSFSKAQLAAYLQRANIDPRSISDGLNTGDTASVRYFVIHDTSSPEIDVPSSTSRSWPPDMNEPTYAGNRLTGWQDTAQRVNLLINRAGQSRVLRQWGAARPLAATKLERNGDVPRARPIFVHVENIQPRLKPAGSWAWIAPDPGLSKVQEQRLALAYMTASLHAGRWLIPAYHFNIDQGFADVHDDPQNMDLASWVRELEALERAVLAEGP